MTTYSYTAKNISAYETTTNFGEDGKTQSLTGVSGTHDFDAMPFEEVALRLKLLIREGKLTPDLSKTHGLFSLQQQYAPEIAFARTYMEKLPSEARTQLNSSASRTA